MDTNKISKFVEHYQNMHEDELARLALEEHKGKEKSFKNRK